MLSNLSSEFLFLDGIDELGWQEPGTHTYSSDEHVQYKYIDA